MTVAKFSRSNHFAGRMMEVLEVEEFNWTLRSSKRGKTMDESLKTSIAQAEDLNWMICNVAKDIFASRIIVSKLRMLTV